jgi:hypothetical protein
MSIQQPAAAASQQPAGKFAADAVGQHTQCRSDTPVTILISFTPGTAVQLLRKKPYTVVGVQYM